MIHLTQTDRRPCHQNTVLSCLILSLKTGMNVRVEDSVLWQILMVNPRLGAGFRVSGMCLWGSPVPARGADGLREECGPPASPAVGRARLLRARRHRIDWPRSEATRATAMRPVMLR